MYPNPWKSAGMGGILQPGAAAGNVFYVDGTTNGSSDVNTGFDPEAPLLTITRALELCVDDHNDYIIVLDYPETHPGGDEASPIDINKNRVHVLGANYPYARGDMQQYLQTPDVAAPVFLVTARWVEIGYFKLAGGDTFGCIALSGGIETKGLAIHHCQFAEKYNGSTHPSYGIDCSLMSCGNWMYVGDCQFYNPITSHGIYLYNPAQIRIERNHFIMVQGNGIHVGTGAAATMRATIVDNYFAIDTDAAGKGITIAGGGTGGCLIANNMANEGKDDMTANPWVDPDTGAPKNAWIGNVVGDAMLHPA